jgi:hypothetical protein
MVGLCDRARFIRDLQVSDKKEDDRNMGGSRAIVARPLCLPAACTDKKMLNQVRSCAKPF